MDAIDELTGTSPVWHQGGVVTAEQLAPFLDPPARDRSQTGKPLEPVDESFVLPVLQKFEGHAEVDEQGNVLYCFPKLQLTAGM